MHASDQELMGYIDHEVREVCKAKSWGHQIRRKWAIRERPVGNSRIEDYEWKLLPHARGELPQPETPGGDFTGEYYVLFFDKPEGKFVLQHDTFHEGMWGSDWEEATYTEIRLDHHMRHVNEGQLPVGWLRDHVLRLVDRFGPNQFSIT